MEHDSVSEHSTLARWGGGVLAPLICLGVAGVAIGRGEARLGRQQEIVLLGSGLWSYGLALTCLALLLHLHYFWESSERLEPYAGIGKIVVGLILLGSLCFLAYCVLHL